MLEKTQTGQATGILMRNWEAAAADNLVATPNAEFVKIASKVIETNPNLHRIVLNVGPALESYEFYGKDFAGSIAQKSYCPQWIILDFLVSVKNLSSPITFTVIQTSSYKDSVLTSNLCLFTNKKIVRNVTDCLNHKEENERLWEEICSAIGHIGFEEFFSRIIGIIPPGWGTLSKPRCGILRLSEINKHVCVIPKRTENHFPDMIDMFDLGRVEKLLESCFDDPVNTFLNEKDKLTHEYINDIVEKLK